MAKVTDVYVFMRKPWKCPDCGVIHRGECPNQVLHKVYALEQRIQVLEDELTHHSTYLEQLNGYLEGVEKRIKRMQKLLKKRR